MKRRLRRRYGRSGAGGNESATRYSGNLKITMKLSADSRSYAVTIRSLERGSDKWHGVVGAPVVGPAVDSRQAYDSTARAALAFAADEGWPVDDEAAVSDSGYFVTGTKAHRFGRR